MPMDDAGGRAAGSAYMQFAKLKARAKYGLASSGVADAAMADIGSEPEDLVLNDASPYGWPPLVEAIAARFDVDPACVVVPGGGCSFANHLAMAAILRPGDAVLIEDPTYELLASAASFLGASVRPFARGPAGAWRFDADAVAACVTPDLSLVVISNLHNPSGALVSAEDVRRLAAASPILLVDEVYLELTFGDGPARTAFSEDGNVVVTSSLTKAYGLSGLRCGWILAPKALAERMRRLNDLFGVKAPHVAERLAVRALGRLPALRARAEALIQPNRAAYREILGRHPALEQTIFDHGTTVFPRLLRGDGDELFQRLTERFETSVAPGRFFGAPDCVRIGLGGDPAMTREGLARIAEALDEI
jgi:aspartate/methionine/tyrosine aminotransferase